MLPCPLLATCPRKLPVKVLTFLTMPVDKSTRFPDQQLHHQRAIKTLFTRADPVEVSRGIWLSAHWPSWHLQMQPRLLPWPNPVNLKRCTSPPPSRTLLSQVVIGLLVEPLTKHPRMKQDDAAQVQLVLTFIRNLLLIPDEKGSSDGPGAARPLQVWKRAWSRGCGGNDKGDVPRVQGAKACSRGRQAPQLQGQGPFV